MFTYFWVRFSFSIVLNSKLCFYSPIIARRNIRSSYNHFLNPIRIFDKFLLDFLSVSLFILFLISFSFIFCCCCCFYLFSFCLCLPIATQTSSLNVYTRCFLSLLELSALLVYSCWKYKQQPNQLKLFLPISHKRERERISKVVYKACNAWADDV